MWHQWFNHNFVKLQEYFLCAKKKKITLFNHFFSSVSVSATCLWEYHNADAKKKSMWQKYVWIHSTQKSTRMTYYFREILKCAYDGHFTHEATGEDLCLAVKWRNWC